MELKEVMQRLDEELGRGHLTLSTYDTNILREALAYQDKGSKTHQAYNECPYWWASLGCRCESHHFIAIMVVLRKLMERGMLKFYFPKRKLV